MKTSSIQKNQLVIGTGPVPQQRGDPRQDSLRGSRDDGGWSARHDLQRGVEGTWRGVDRDVPTASPRSQGAVIGEEQEEGEGDHKGEEAEEEGEEESWEGSEEEESWEASGEEEEDPARASASSSASALAPSRIPSGAS